MLVLGPLVARLGKARVSLPGGCAIGARPINLHLKGLEEMGVKVTLAQGYVEAKVKRLEGAEIILDFPRLPGLKTCSWPRRSARGRTMMRNAAQEPGSLGSGEVSPGHGCPDRRDWDGCAHHRGG